MWRGASPRACPERRSAPSSWSPSPLRQGGIWRGKRNANWSYPRRLENGNERPSSASCPVLSTTYKKIVNEVLSMFCSINFVLEKLINFNIKGKNKNRNCYLTPWYRYRSSSLQWSWYLTWWRPARCRWSPSAPGLVGHEEWCWLVGELFLLWGRCPQRSESYPVEEVGLGDRLTLKTVIFVGKEGTISRFK